MDFALCTDLDLALGAGWDLALCVGRRFSPARDFNAEAGRVFGFLAGVFGNGLVLPGI